MTQWLWATKKKYAGHVEQPAAGIFWLMLVYAFNLLSASPSKIVI